MVKLRAKWEPKFEQDFEAMTDENSPFYDNDFVEEILKDYASIDAFKLSEEYRQMKKNYHSTVNNKKTKQ